MLTPETRARDFPSLEGRTYLNTAAEGIPSLALKESLLQYFADKQLGMDGRDATDVPLVHTFGQHTLKSFKVWTDEAAGEDAQAERPAA